MTQMVSCFLILDCSVLVSLNLSLHLLVTGKIGADYRLLSNDNGSSVTGQRWKVFVHSQQWQCFVRCLSCWRQHEATCRSNFSSSWNSFHWGRGKARFLLNLVTISRMRDFHDHLIPCRDSISQFCCKKLKKRKVSVFFFCCCLGNWQRSYKEGRGIRRRISSGEVWNGYRRLCKKNWLVWNPMLLVP